jgi:hypothetical protein
MFNILLAIPKLYIKHPVICSTVHYQTAQTEAIYHQTFKTNEPCQSNERSRLLLKFYW